MVKGTIAQIKINEITLEKKKIIHYHRNLCYGISNSKVATVTNNSRIKAVGKEKRKICA